MRSPKQLVGEIEVAWAAGFFDGEGWTGITQPHDRDVVTLQMHVSQTDENVLERFRAAVGGIGKIESMRLREGYKQVWRWRVHGQDVVDVGAKLYDYLCQPKQDQLITAIGKRLAYEELASAKVRGRGGQLRLVS